MRRIVGLRWRHRRGPVQIAGQLGMASSTVHVVLARCRINRLSHIDRVTGEPLRRYEHAHPGSLIHVDVTKFANIPDGGGHKFQQSKRNARQTARRTGQRGSTELWPMDGPMPGSTARRLYGSTAQPKNATPPCRAGSTPTIITEPTPLSEASHRSPA